MRPVWVEVVRAAPVPSRPHLLEDVDRQRWTRLRAEADRDRLFTGVHLRRMVLQQRARREVPVERRCRGCGARDHGEVQPRRVVDRARWRTSLSHSGNTVLLALAEFSADADVDLGIDIEAAARVSPAVARFVLSAPERSRWLHPTSALLSAVWTAKEAALKAAGCGLHASMTDLIVSTGGSSGERSIRVLGADPLLAPLRTRPSRLVDLTDVVCDPAGPDGPQCAALVVVGAEIGAGIVRVTTRQVSAEELLARSTTAELISTNASPL